MADLKNHDRIALVVNLAPHQNELKTYYVLPNSKMKKRDCQLCIHEGICAQIISYSISYHRNEECNIITRLVECGLPSGADGLPSSALIGGRTGSLKHMRTQKR